MKTAVLTKFALVVAAFYVVCPGMSWAEVPEYDITIGRTINVPGPSGLVYRDDGFWVISWSIGDGTRLHHYSSIGVLLGNYSVPEEYLVQGLAWDGKYWWIADNIHPSGDKIKKCELTGTGLNVLKEYIWPGPGSGPVALEWAQGYLWVADNHSDLICRVTVGNTSFTSVEPWSSGNIAPYGLAWDGTNMWSSCSPAGGGTSGPREIYKHDANGNIIEIWHYPGADGPPPGSYGGCATDIAFVGNRLWYCDYDKNQIIEAIFSQPAENWQIVYQTDFSSDPGWITSWPDRYVWDPATGTYCFSHIMYTYSYVPIAYDPTLKYKLEFDINLTQCEWGSYFNLGLWDADMLTKGPTHWHVRYHHVDEGNSACIVYWTNDLYGGGDSPIMPFALNTWYHNKAIYDPTSDMFTLEITRKDDGVLLGTYTLAAVGEFLNIERLGISCTQSTYGDRLQAGCIDNVVLSTLAAGPPVDLKGRIAFVSPSGQKIYVMNADGSSRQQLPLPPLDVVHAPQWSRDGLWLTFSGGPGLNSQIYIVRPDGSGFRRVTNGSGDMVEPSFSPDGSQIAFCGSDGTALYIINTDGTGLRRLPVGGSFPEWWPLGDKILYSNWGRTYESDLFLYDCAAGQSIQITHHTPGQAFIRAAWSPNGRRLAVDFRDRNRTGNKRDVLIMNADGSNPYNFTAAWPDSDEGAACWSPDGQFILFVSDRTGNFDIWYSPVDVFSPVNITNSPEDEDMPAMGTIPEAQPVYHVDAVNGNDNNNGLSRRTAFATIAKGIDSATNRYKVLVYPGVYREEVDFKGKAITIQGVATKASIPIIENPGDFAVSIYRGEGPRAILKNFVIKNSFMAVFIAGSSPTIKNLNIVNNKYGVEAYAGSEPDVSNCIFWENSDSDLFGCEARYSFVQQDIEPLPLRGLVACWSFDENNRNIVPDKSGNGHNGTIYGATWTQGIAGTGLCFDGLNDYVEVPDDGGLSLTDAITVSAWIWLDPDWLPEGHGGAGAIVCKHYDVAGKGYALRVLKDRRLRALLEGQHFDSQSKLNPGQWTHVAFTLDPSNGMVGLYINGNKEGRGAIVGSLTSSGCELRIGDQSCYPGGTGTEVFYGAIDEALIYNRALSPREIQKLYLSQLSSDPLFADAANSDYHLLSERGRYWPRADVWVLDKVTSPCIDGGDPDDDVLDEPMPNGGRIDMGSFGGTPFASMSDIKWLDGDVNHDGRVNLADLAMLAENWLRDDNP